MDDNEKNVSTFFWWSVLGNVDVELVDDEQQLEISYLFAVLEKIEVWLIELIIDDAMQNVVVEVVSISYSSS